MPLTKNANIFRISNLSKNWWNTKDLFSKTIFCSCKQKIQKNLFWERSVFLFFMFSVFSKTTFFITIKKCFHYFFAIQIIDCFSYFFSSLFLCFLICFLCFHKGEFYPTTTPLLANLFFFFKLLKLIYLHMVTKSSFF